MGSGSGGAFHVGAIAVGLLVTVVAVGALVQADDASAIRSDRLAVWPMDADHDDEPSDRRVADASSNDHHL